MLKIKLPLLALSISSILAPQISSAAPIKILALGDSITNGVHNGGNALAYRDDLHLLLQAGGYSYKYEGKCPNDSSGDETGSCAPYDFGGEPGNASLYSPGVVDEPATSGTVFSHEGRAGKHANYFNEGGRLNDLLTSWYYPEAIFLHIGTNDIYQQENDVNRANSLVEEITYTTTMADIDSMVTTIKNLSYAPKIYLAKILPIGRVVAAGVDVDFTGPGGDAATRLNQLLQTKYGSDPKVTLVDQNTDFTYASHMSSDKVHPKGAGEAKMAGRWFAKFKLDFAQNGPTATASILSVTSETVKANNTDFATVTLQAKRGSELITWGGDTVKFESAQNEVTISDTVDNGDGTYTATVKRDGIAGIVTVTAKLNGNLVTSTSTITFDPPLAAQEIYFVPPTTKAFGDPDFSITGLASRKLGTINPTGLAVELEVKPSSSTVCTVTDDTPKKVKILSAGDCTLIASQAGGKGTGDIDYDVAAPVEKTITVNKAEQTITFSNTPATAFIGGEFTAAAASTSDLSVSILSATPNKCDIDSASKVTIKATGTCKLTATQAGDGNYKAAAPVTHEVEVSTDVVTIPAIADKTMGNSAFTVNATAKSGEDVTLTTLTAGVCTVDGNKVTLVAAGTCELKATAGTASATTEFTVKKSANQLAMDTVTKVINGSGNITVAQLEPIKGLKNLKLGTDYTSAIKNATYEDKNNPTLVELQKAIDDANSDSNSSGGSTSPLWLLTLGLVGLRRKLSARKQQS